MIISPKQPPDVGQMRMRNRAGGSSAVPRRQRAQPCCRWRKETNRHVTQKNGIGKNTFFRYLLSRSRDFK